MDDSVIKDEDELADLDEVSLKNPPIIGLDDELEDTDGVADPDILSIDDLADAEDEEEEDMYGDGDEM